LLFEEVAQLAQGDLGPILKMWGSPQKVYYLVDGSLVNLEEDLAVVLAAEDGEVGVLGAPDGSRPRLVLDQRQLPERLPRRQHLHLHEVVLERRLLLRVLSKLGYCYCVLEVSARLEALVPVFGLALLVGAPWHVPTGLQGLEVGALREVAVGFLLESLRQCSDQGKPLGIVVHLLEGPALVLVGH